MKKRVSRKSILVYPFVIFLVLVVGGIVLSIVEDSNTNTALQGESLNKFIAEYGPDALPQIPEEVSNDLPSYLVAIGTFLAVIIVIIAIHSYKWTVTANGIEMKHGILPWTKHYGFVAYSDIYQIYSYKPKLKLLGWLFHYGTIAFSTTAGSTEEYSEKMMTFPSRFVSDATDALRNSRSGRTSEPEISNKKAVASKTTTKTPKAKTTTSTATSSKSSTKKSATKKPSTGTKASSKSSKKKVDSSTDIVSQLAQLSELKKSGAIDDAEFKKLKKKIIE